MKNFYLKLRGFILNIIKFYKDKKDLLKDKLNFILFNLGKKKFYYQFDNNGEIESGVGFASNEYELKKDFKNKTGFEAINITQEAFDNFFLDFVTDPKSLFGKPNEKDIFFLFVSLSNASKANISIIEALEDYESNLESSDKYSFKKILKKLIGEIKKQRKSISECFSEYPDYFSKKTISFLKMGESSQDFGQSFELIIKQSKLEGEFKKIRGKLLKSVLSDLAVILTILIIAAFKIAPTIMDIFKGHEDQLPGISVVVFAFSNFMINHTFELITGSIFAGILLAGILMNEQGKNFLEQLKFKLPVFKNAAKSENIFLFVSTYQTLASAKLGKGEILKEIRGNLTYNLAKETVDKMINKFNSKTTKTPIADTFKENKDIWGLQELNVVQITKAPELSDSLDSSYLNFVDTSFEIFKDNNTQLTETTSAIMGILIKVIGFGTIIGIFMPLTKIAALVD